MSFNVLVCSAGRRVELVRILQETLDELAITGRVLACDVSELSAAGHVADGFFLVPEATSPGFLPAVRDLCAAEEIRLIVPTTDTTLAAYARSVRAFAEVGVAVAVSSPETVAIAGDKRRTGEFFRAHGIPTVRQGEVSTVLRSVKDWPLPLVVKPVIGSSSVGVSVATDWLQFESAVIGRDVIVQEPARGSEYTIDLFVDRAGRLRDAVPRKRLEVRAGEVSKGMTVRAEPLLDLAERIVACLPACFGVLNVQAFWDGVNPPQAIEINPRFGGGFPLTHAAGAPFVRWLLESAMNRDPLSPGVAWQPGLLMLRYDGAVLVPTREGALVP